VKGQSNVEIAGFWRNIFRYSAMVKRGVQHWIYNGDLKSYCLYLNLKYSKHIVVRPWARRFMSQKGNSPDL